MKATLISQIMEASLNRCKRMVDQAGNFLKQLAEKLELVLFISEQ